MTEEEYIEITWNELRENFSFENPAHGRKLTAEITHRTPHWNQCRQLTVSDTEKVEGSVCFYVDKPEPQFSYDDMQVGHSFVLRSPRLHYFLDKSIGMRVENAKSLFGGVTKGYFSEDRRVTYATLKKTRGNELFKMAHYKDAVEAYEVALGYVGNARENPKPCNEIAVSCNLNIAACLLLMNKYGEVSEVCRRALSIPEATHEQRAKAYYRMGDAAYRQHNYREALGALTKSLEHLPSDPDTTALYDTVQKALTLSKEEEKKLFRWQIRGGRPVAGVRDVFARQVVVSSSGASLPSGILYAGIYPADGLDVHAVLEIRTDAWSPFLSLKKGETLMVLDLGWYLTSIFVWVLLYTARWIPSLCKWIAKKRRGKRAQGQRSYKILTTCGPTLATYVHEVLCASTKAYPLLVASSPYDYEAIASDALCIVLYVALGCSIQVIEAALPKDSITLLQFKSILAKECEGNLENYMRKILKLTPEMCQRVQTFYNAK